MGGNDLGITEDEWKLEAYSAAHVSNKTGLGLIKMENIKNNPLFKYTHISTEPFLENSDEIMVLPYRLNLREE